MVDHMFTASILTLVQTYAQRRGVESAHHRPTHTDPRPAPIWRQLSMTRPRSHFCRPIPLLCQGRQTRDVGQDRSGLTGQPDQKKGVTKTETGENHIAAIAPRAGLTVVAHSSIMAQVAMKEIRHLECRQMHQEGPRDRVQ